LKGQGHTKTFMKVVLCDVSMLQVVKKRIMFAYAKIMSWKY